MQTTLLGLAVAIILALVTALVGPLFVDWGRYRADFEAEASRIAGLPVRVRGAIDVRLLPTPSLLVHDLEIGKDELKVRTLAVELALGPLLRGEWRAAELHLAAPQLRLGLDSGGRVAAPAVAFDPDQLAIDRLVIDDGRAVFADAASGATLTLDKLSFQGELRSLLGPFKGDGAFVSAGALYGFRLAGGRRGDDGAIKLRLGVNPAERPLMIETEGMLAFEGGAPRYEGALTLMRPAGAVLADGKTVASEPWRLTSRVKATAQEALIEQIEFLYGPEDRATRLGGTANVKFGSRPQFEGVLSARQVDLDRATGSPEGARRSPVAAVQAFLTSFVAGARLPLPVKLGIDIDALTIGGATLQSVRGDLQSDSADAWTIDTFEFRAPGLTQVRLSGHFKVAGSAVQFIGPASVESSDPKALVAWLEGRPEGKRELIGTLRARGEVTLGSERIAVERLKAEIDRKAMEGRLAYLFASGDRRARLEAELSAAEINIEAAMAFVSGALGGATFERPGEIALALSIGKASYAGIEANRAEAHLKFDASGLQIERLDVSDFRGASLSATGLIDTSSSSPRGAVSVALDAPKLDGVIAVAAKWAPQTAEAIRRYAPQLGPAKVNARFEVAPAKDKPAQSAAKLTVEGRLGVVRLDLKASSTGDPDAPTAAALHVDGTVEADEGAVLAALFGVDRYVAVDMRPATLSLLLDGPTGGAMRLDARLAAGGLWASGAGSLQLGKDGPAGTFDLSVSAAGAHVPGREGRPVPLAVSTRLGLSGRKLELENLSGKLAGATLAGRLALALGDPIQVEGRLQAQDVDGAAVIGVLIGTPPRAGKALWASEPFGRGALASVAGRIEVEAARVAMTPALGVRELRGVARFDRTGIAFENVAGVLADGRFSASAEFRQARAGISARAKFDLVKADMAALVPPGRFPVAGRLSLAAEAEGTGLSPAALVGALHGAGTLSVENVRIAGLDPKAIDAALRAAERGLPLERVPGIVAPALEKGPLDVAAASATLTIADGRVRVNEMAAPAAEGAGVAVVASLDLIEDAVDARFTLSVPAPAQDAVAGRRPELAVTLKGPWNATRRELDTSALMSFVTLRTVEQEARRLEAAEREAKLIQAAEAARRAERERVERERAERAHAEREQAERERQANAAPPSVPIERAPELPPPIDIKPVPVKPLPRAAKPQPQAQAQPPAQAPAQAQPQTQPQAPPPPARTPLQILQGWFSND